MELVNKRLRLQSAVGTDTVNTRYQDDHDDFDEGPQDREISLGATTILGIFFLLALVCAVFFGVGYSFGRKSSAVAMSPAAGDSVEASTIKTTGSAKPSAGEAASEAPAPEPVVTAADDTGTTAPTPAVQQPAPVAVEKPAPVKHEKPAPTRTVVAAVEKPATLKPTPVAPAAPHPAAAGPAVPSLVQVAAVSHQEDADVLLNALKRRGYNVSVRHEAQDKLLHVQIGPLASRKDADAMRQRLLADGYNAIVK